MRFFVVSGFGCGLSFWHRLQCEGHDVRVWIKDDNKTVGDGIVPKVGTYDEGVKWAKEAPSIVLFESSGCGDRADQARKAGLAVVGGGSYMDRLENDREFGFKVAEQAGCLIPPYKEFPNVAATIAWARSNKVKPSFWKTDKYLDGDSTHGVDDSAHLIEYLQGVQARYGGNFANIVQEKVEGVPLSTARWWNGRDWVGPYEATYENKKFMAGDVGPSTGCSFNALWFYEEENPIIAQLLGWDNLTEQFRAKQAPPGLYDINAIVTAEGEAYFLEWTPRFGYDSEPTSFRLIPSVSEHLYAVAFGHTPAFPYGDLAYAVRMSVPPYPWEHGSKGDKGGADGVRVIGGDISPESSYIPYQVRMGELGLEMAGPEGIVGLAFAQGEDIYQLGEEAIEAAEELKRTPGLQYRKDGAEDCAEKAKELAAAGIEVHVGLLCEVD